jgi:hypothetical protein
MVSILARLIVGWMRWQMIPETHQINLGRVHAEKGVPILSMECLFLVER